ncbi:MAG: sigma-70 family RNA polymerase sigma factor [Bacillota bacterium]
MIPDDLLVQKVKEGHLESFEVLVERYQKQVYNMAYRYTGNSEDAYDLSQEAFIKAYKGIKSFRQEAAFKTWIYHITSNVCKDFLRKANKYKEVSIDAPIHTEEGEMEKQITDRVNGPEEIYEIKELSEFIQSMISSLPNDYREVIVLREFQQLSYEEMSDILDCSLGTVKSRLNRARNMLKEKFIRVREQSNMQLRQIR